MKYLSVCSGIEAATVAWHSLGWEPLAFSEIEPFPRKVLSHHYPDVPLHGDFTLLREQDWIKDADILVGGTPCQAFSVAGLRHSLNDDRGNLTLEFVRLADAIDAIRSIPCTIVWENVPGVLSVKDNAFGCFLGALAGESLPLVATGGRWANAGFVDGPKRTIAWRILDAQYFGVAQRRRRLFVVASARTDIDPAEILFEFEGLRRDTPPSREQGQEVAATIAARFGISRNNHEEVVATNSHVAGTLSANAGGLNRPAGNANELDFCVATTIQARMGSGGFDLETETPVVVAHITGPITAGISKGMRGTEGIDSNWAVVQPTYAIQGNMIGRNDSAGPQGDGVNEEVCFTLNTTDRHAIATHEIAGTMISNNGGGGWSNSINHAASGYMAIQPTAYASSRGIIRPLNDVMSTLDAATESRGTNQQRFIHQEMAVRRLTPRECERLQGFPDDYTNIPGAADGPRYKSLGNSMAVPVMAWIGERIANALG